MMHSIHKLHPHHIWEEKGGYYQAPYSEVKSAMATWLQEMFWRQRWDDHTPVKHKWYLGREQGLSVWCNYEANLRLNQAKRRVFTLKEFEADVFIEDVTVNKREALADPYWSSLILSKREAGDFKFFEKLGKAETNTPADLNSVFCMVCHLWDRAAIPFEFWTYPAVVSYCSHALERAGRSAGVVNEETVKHWTSRHKLTTKAKKFVRSFGEDGLRLSSEKHLFECGMPVDVLAKIPKQKG
jgi:hypothetical protein